MALVIAAALVPAAVLLMFALLARWRASQRPRRTGPQFAPLPGATVLEDALLCNSDRRAISAVVIDLAVQRKIRLIAREENGKRSTIGIEVVEYASFTSDEEAVLAALFGRDTSAGRVHRFSKDRVLLSRRLNEVLGTVDGRLAAAGLFRPGRGRGAIATLWFFAICGIIATVLLAVVAGAMGDMPALVVALLSVLMVVASMILTPKTWRRFLPPSEGPRAHLEGIREYIALAEREPLRYLQSVHGAELRTDVSSDAQLQRFLLNERLLPYAVMFGEEKSWAQQLRREGATLPDTEGFEDAVAALDTVLAVIELTGTAIHLVLAIGEGVGGVLEGL